MVSNNENTAVRTGGCSKTVDFFHNNIDRRVKPERILRSRQIHIYCFGNADRFYTHFVQLVGHTQRVFPADGDNGVYAELFNVFQQFCRTVIFGLKGLVREVPKLVPP